MNSLIVKLVVRVSINHCAKSGNLFNKMFYSVFTQLQYISPLATCFGFVKKKPKHLWTSL